MCISSIIYFIYYYFYYNTFFFCFKSAHQFCNKSKKRNQSFPKEKHIYCKLGWSNPHILPLSGLKMKVKSSNHRNQKFALLWSSCSVMIWRYHFWSHTEIEKHISKQTEVWFHYLRFFLSQFFLCWVAAWASNNQAILPNVCSGCSEAAHCWQVLPVPKA